ncbi:MAG TPA: penicillin acylase family protein [Steroidobacteraceae bacterium]|nr:penicillin acylase family protein [Steroidobacteraceae bacterium]
MTVPQRLLSLTIVLAACGLAFASPSEESELQRSAAASVAHIQGEREVPRLHHAVRVQRDTWGVAHIYAQDEHDLFFAQGFVVAQDRLFQMELWKRSGQGRLAELLGPSAIQRDINARRLQYRGSMADEYRSYAPDTQAILQAFTDGINAYIADVQKPGGPGLPIEFRIAGFRPEPWKPSDCLNRLAAYAMMSNASRELLHAQAVALLGADRATGLFQFDPPVRLEPVPGIDLRGLTPAILADIVSSDRRIPFPASSLQESNNWTLSGKLTASGLPLLANDPHRVIAQPSLRYIVHLNAPGWNVIGAGEPGLPGVAAGHNEQIAWGFTIFGLDQEDLYLETLDPQDATRYKTARGWKRMRQEHETIHVRGAPDFDAVVQWTDHGPVLWADGRRALALRWIGAEPGTAGYLGSLTLDRAQNWQEFESAMPHWKVPSENIVYADRAGNIGEHSTGLAPLRRNFTGLLPVPADGRFEWAGFVPNSKLPHSYNPAAGFIASANHKMIPKGYPYAVGFEWAPPTRYERIREVLESASQKGRKLTMQDMEALQTDVVSLPARRLQALLRQTADSSGDAQAREARKLLLDWDCALQADSAPAALYEMWGEQLRPAVTRRAVPPAALEFVQTWPLARVVDELTVPREAVFGIDAAATRDALLQQTLQAAYGELAARLGSDPGTWTWGALHKAYFRHALDAGPGLSGLLDRGPVERPGDGDVVQATSFDQSSFDQIAGASYREIFDLSDWDNSVAVNVPGQSGQPGSKHFDDLLPLWSAGGYFPLKYSKAAVDAVTTDTLTLRP